MNILNYYYLMYYNLLAFFLKHIKQLILYAKNYK